MHLARSLVLGLVLAAAGCTGSSEQGGAGGSGATGGAGGATGGAGGASGGAGGAACDGASGTFPAGLTELAWDDGVASSHVRAQTWSITVNGHSYVLADGVLHEAVRFELEHPARIHGFRVMWADLPAGVDPVAPLEAGLYPDFGYNGFDFWPEPLWTGSRCAAGASSFSPDVPGSGAWVDYVFDTPVEVAHPGLVYVAHRAATPSDPVWAFDATELGAGDCALFDECRSAMNLPEAETSQFYNGVSFPFQYDYLVRLEVEYTDSVAPADKLFQAAAGAPESGHVSWGDYDADGYDDLLLSGPALYRNLGDGSFADVTAASGIGALGLAATGGVWGDYDNDGCLDAFLYAESYTAPDALLHSNCDGTFSDATAAAGIVDLQTYNDCGDPLNTRSPSAAAAWLDVDADGYLDLYVANFICWASYTYYVDTVFRNNGDGSFTDWTAQHGFSPLKTPSRGAAPIDFDRDGDVDLLVHNYVLKANLFFENLGGGTVQERAAALGLTGTKHGVYYGHTIGTAWGDLDNDGDFDVLTANLAHPRFYGFSDKTEVLMNDGTGHFLDASGDWAKPVNATGLRYQETHSVPVLADVDLDGNLDLAITAVYDGRPTDFYWGNGDGTFRLDAYHAGLTTENGWGIAAADYDLDGDPDLFATKLFTNTRAQTGHFLEVKAVGNVSSNRDALGATVAVTAGGTTRLRHVEGGTGKGGQDSLYLHFGLGAATTVSEL
ncbi:MAG: CRTAC1 family protein, partial [Polyangiaceae bacterium]|nr:CRTAC1 family protein [Polyangiaceae bacterium]